MKINYQDHVCCVDENEGILDLKLDEVTALTALRRPMEPNFANALPTLSLNW